MRNCVMLSRELIPPGQKFPTRPKPFIWRHYLWVSIMLVDILTLRSFEVGAASFVQILCPGWERNASTDPELREGLEVPLISTRDCVFLAAFYAESPFSCRVRFDLFHKRTVYDHGAMNSNESKRFELFRHHGN